MEENENARKINQLRAAARLVGQMLAEAGDFYDVAEELANGYALGTLRQVAPSPSPAYTGPSQTAASTSAVSEPNFNARQEEQVRPSKQYTRLCLIALNELRSVTGNVIGWRVDDAKESGMLWAEIGDALEITKQAAQQRYGSAGGKRPAV